MSKLTEKQETELENYYQQKISEGITTNKKLDKEKVHKCINDLYYNVLNRNMDVPLVYVASPIEACLHFNAANGSEENHMHDIIFSSYNANWVSYYHFGINYLGATEGVEPELIKGCNQLHDLIAEIHAILPCDDMCYVIEHPIRVSIKDNDMEKFVLHNINEAAIEYSDGTKLCIFNGVNVPDYFLKDDLDIVDVLKENDIDVRREGLAKVLARDPLAVEKCSRVVETFKGERPWEDYQILDVDFRDGKKRICLKMFDVASGKYVIERVEDDCTTVKNALAFRDNEDEYVDVEEQT